MNSIESVQVVNPKGLDDIAAHITITEEQYLMIEAVEEAGYHAFQTWVKADASRAVNVSYGDDELDIQASTDWQKVEFIFNAENISTVNILLPVGEYWLYNTKLETGNVITDYTQAPEDIIAAMDNQANAIVLLEQRYTADIQATEQAITEKLTSGYYTKGETESLVSEVSTEWKQTAEGFEMNFSNIEKNIEDVAGSADARFQEINSYIRYEDGSIILGRSDSPLVLKIQNDRISFTQNNSEVAYFSNNRLYVKDGEYTNSLQLGKFAFIPRDNGNLSFKKVTD